MNGVENPIPSPFKNKKLDLDLEKNVRIYKSLTKLKGFKR
jgi:hypothetical protein